MQYIEGYISRLISDISKNLNEGMLKWYASILIDKETISEMIYSILLKYEIVIKGDVSSFPYAQNPEKGKIDSIRKKRKYNIKLIEQAYERDRENFLSGKENPNGIASSPFSHAYIDNQIKFTGKLEVDLIKELDDIFYKWQSEARAVGSRSLLCDYPYIGFFPAESMKKFCQTDLESSVINEIENIDLKRYVTFQPLSSSASGLFRAGGSYRASPELINFNDLVAVEDYVAAFITELKTQPDGVNLVNYNGPFVMNEKGSALINYLTTQCFKNYFTAQTSGEVIPKYTYSGHLNEIVKILFPEVGRHNSRHYDIAIVMLYNLGDTGLIKVTDKSRINKKALFSNIEIDTTTKIYTVSLGTPFVEDLIDTNVATVIGPILDKLKNPVSKLLYQAMKAQRLADLTNSNEKTIQHPYLLNYLMMIVRVNGNQNTKIKKYMEALDEMVREEVLIKSNTIKGELFIVAWLPFSEDEKKDILQIRSLVQQDIALEGV